MLPISVNDGGGNAAGQFFGYPWIQGKTRITEHGYDKDPLPANVTNPQVYMDAHAADLGLTLEKLVSGEPDNFYYARDCVALFQKPL